VSGWTWLILGVAAAATVAAGLIINHMIRKATPSKPVDLPERTASAR
jgi:hypothetical protein